MPQNAAALLNVGVNQSFLISDLNRAFRYAEGQFKGLNIRINENAIRQPLGRINGDMNQFNKSLEAATARVVAFTSTLSLIGGTIGIFTGMVTAAIEVEKRFKEINSVFGLSAESLQKFSRATFDAARSTGRSFEEATKAALEFSRQGLTAVQTAERITSALLLTRLSGLEVSESVDAITTALNGFNRESLTSIEVVNKLAAVDARFAVSSKDLAAALERVGSTAQDAGVGFDKLLGLVTSARQITGRDGAVIGNALKSIFTRVQRSDTLDEFESLGVAIRDLRGNILPADQLLTGLATRFDSLTFSQQQYISELTGGLFQINQLRAQLADLGRAYNITESATKAASGATEEAAKRSAVLNTSLSSLIQNAKTAGFELSAVFGKQIVTNPLKNLLGAADGNAFREFRDTVISGLRKIGDEKAEFESVGEQMAKGIGEGLAKGLGNLLSGPGLVLATVLGSRLIGLTTSKIFDAVKSTASGPNKTDAFNRGFTQLASGATEGELRRLATADSIAKKEAAILAILERQQAVVAATSGARIQQANLFATNPIARSAIRRLGSAAEGHLPDYIEQEQHAVRKGVGGATAGAKPVVIPNFNYGKGVRGTVVANTDEYIVKNYANSGGDAVFNKEMVASMGLPLGAQKINAAGGYVPNFAPKPVIGLRGAVDIIRRYKDSGITFKRDAFSYYNKDDDSVSVKKGAPFSTVLHELGHSAARRYSSAYGLYAEQEANDAAVRMIKRAGGTKENIDNYKSQALPAFKSYKHSAIKDAIVTKYPQFNFDPVAQVLSKKVNFAAERTEDPVRVNAAWSKLTQHFAKELGGREFKSIVSGLRPELRMNYIKNGAEGYLPNYARLSRKDLASLLKSKQFQSIVYEKADGETAKYHTAQYRVRRDLLEGASAPAGYDSWTDLDEKTGSLVLRSTKQGDKNAKFRRFTLDGIKQVIANNKTYNLAGGFKPVGLRRGATAIDKGKFGEALKSEDNKFVFKRMLSENYPADRIDKEIRNEYAISKLSESLDLPVAKVFGSAKRSVARGGLYKEYVDGELAVNALTREEYGFIRHQLEKKFAKAGIAAHDLHGKNLMIRKGHDGTLDGKLANAVVIDPGNFEVADDLRGGELMPRYAKAYYSRAAGYIPNLSYYDDPRSPLMKSKRYIGGGFGKAYQSKVRPDLVFKKFKGNVQSPAVQGYIEEEFVISREAEEKGLPVVPVYGSLARAKKRGGIFKPFVDGFTLPEAQAMGLDSDEIADQMRSLFRANGINPSDLGHPGNVKIQGSAEQFKRLVKLAGREEATNLALKKAIVVDPGAFRPLKALADGFEPVRDAITREKAAGVPQNQIYVDCDPRLKSPQNPHGLLVANRRDEPIGGFQGVDRVVRQGKNPKTAGQVPNFVDTFSQSDFKQAGAFINKADVAAINTLFDALRRASSEKSAQKVTDQIINFVQKLSLNATAAALVLEKNGTLLFNARNIFENGVNQFGKRAVKPIEPVPFADVNGPRSSLSFVSGNPGGGSGNSGSGGGGSGGVSSGGRGRPAVQFLPETDVERKFARNLYNIPNAILSAITGNTVDRQSRPFVVDAERGFINSSRNRQINSNDISKFVDISRAKTFDSELVATTQREIASGRSLVEALDIAAVEWRATGGSARGLRISILKNTKALDEYESTLRANQVAARQNQQTSLADQRLAKGVQLQPGTTLFRAKLEQADRNARDEYLTSVGKTAKDTLTPREQAAQDRLARARVGKTTRDITGETAQREFEEQRRTERVARGRDNLIQQVFAGKSLSGKQSDFLDKEFLKEGKLRGRELLGPKADSKVIDKFAEDYVKKKNDDLSKAFDTAFALNNAKKDPTTFRGKIAQRITDFFKDDLRSFEKDVKAGRISGDIDTQRQLATNRSLERRGRLNSTALTGAFLASTATGFIDEGQGGTREGKIRGGISGALQGGATGISVGAFFGPIGIAIGAAVGGIGGAIVGVLGKARKSFEEVARAIEKTAAENTNLINSTNEYIRLQIELNELQRRGAEPEKIQRVVDAQQKALLDIKDSDLRDRLINAGSNTEKLQVVATTVSDKKSADDRRGNAVSALKRLNEVGSASSSTTGDFLTQYGADLLQSITFQQVKLKPVAPKVTFNEKQNAEIKAAAGLFVQSGSTNTTKFISELARNPTNAGLEELVKNSTIAREEQKDVIDNLQKILKDEPEKITQLLVSMQRVIVQNQKDLDKATKARKVETNATEVTNRLVDLAISTTSDQSTVSQSREFRNKIQRSIFDSSIDIGGFSEDQDLRRRNQFNTRTAQNFAVESVDAGRKETFAEFTRILTANDKQIALERADDLAKFRDTGSADDFEKIIREVSNKDVKRSLQELVDTQRRTERTAALTLEETKLTNQLNELTLQARQKEKLLTNAQFNPATGPNLATTRATSLLADITPRGKAFNANNGLDFIRTLDSLGVPRGDKTFDRERSLQVTSTRQTLSEILSETLGGQVGTSNDELKKASQNLRSGARSELDVDLADRIDKAIRLFESNPQAEIKKLVSGSEFDIEKLFDSGAFDIQTVGIVTPLKEISGSSRKSNELLADIRLLMQQREAGTKADSITADLETVRKAQVNKTNLNTDNLNNAGSITKGATLEETHRELVQLLSEQNNILGKFLPSEIARAERFAEIGGARASFSTPGDPDGGLIVPRPGSGSVIDPVRLDAVKVNANKENSLELKRETTQLDTFFSGFRSQIKSTEDQLNNFAKIGAQVATSIQSNFSNAFGDFATGTKKGSAAFRDFAVSVLGDASRMFASRATSQFLNLAIGSLGIPKAQGGLIPEFATGGMVPAMLTGGEYFIGPRRAREIGLPALNKINSGSAPRAYARGGEIRDSGMIRGGSGMYDDVHARVASGGYVIKKSSVEKYGADYLDALAKGRVKKRFWGGLLVGALTGAGVGYATGGKKGAVTGAIIGGIGGGLAQNYAQSGNVFKSGSAGQSMFSFQSNGAAFNQQSQAAAVAAGQPYTASAAQYAGATSPTTSAGGWQGILAQFGISAALGLGSALAAGRTKEGKPWSDAEISANRGIMESDQQKMINAESKPVMLQQNPQGGYSLVGFGGPATRRWNQGGDIPMMNRAHGADLAPLARYAEGGATQGGYSAGGSPTIQVNNNITIHQDGSVESNSEVKGGSDKKDTNVKLAENLGKEMEATALRVIHREQRQGGSLYRV